MKKIKQISLKAMLLTILAVLTIGFTGCSDELSGDQTQGKPGYLTINVKTLKPNQSKFQGTGATDDFTKIQNLNIFVFNASHNKIIHKYYNSLTVSATGVVSDIDIAVSSLTVGSDYVVVVANYGSRIDDDVDTYTELESLDIATVGNYSTSGLIMTGKAEIIAGTPATAYFSNVKVAPVVAKITVDWELTDDVLANYDVTGVYVANAISNTKLAIIRDNQHDGTDWAAGNILPAGFINLTGATPTRTAASGLIQALRDYNFYNTTDVTNASLKDEMPDATFVTTTGISLPASYTKLIDATNTKLHYYVGENYSNNATAITAGSGAMVADNSTHQNTLVVVRVTPLSTAPDYIKLMGHRYYTYEFNRGSTGLTGQNIKNLGAGAIGPDDTGVGFSVRRKTNYSLKFNLSSIGSENPFTRLQYLRVSVEADAWDTETVNY